MRKELESPNQQSKLTTFIKQSISIYEAMMSRRVANTVRSIPQEFTKLKEQLAKTATIKARREQLNAAISTAKNNNHNKLPTVLKIPLIAFDLIENKISTKEALKQLTELLNIVNSKEQMQSSESQNNNEPELTLISSVISYLNKPTAKVSNWVSIFSEDSQFVDDVCDLIKSVKLHVTEQQNIELKEAMSKLRIKYNGTLALLAKNNEKMIGLINFNKRIEKEKKVAYEKNQNLEQKIKSLSNQLKEERVTRKKEINTNNELKQKIAALTEKLEQERSEKSEIKIKYQKTLISLDKKVQEVRALIGYIKEEWERKEQLEQQLAEMKEVRDKIARIEENKLKEMTKEIKNYQRSKEIVYKISELEEEGFKDPVKMENAIKRLESYVRRDKLFKRSFEFMKNVMENTKRANNKEQEFKWVSQAYQGFKDVYQIIFDKNLSKEQAKQKISEYPCYNFKELHRRAKSYTSSFANKLFFFNKVEKKKALSQEDLNYKQIVQATKDWERNRANIASEVVFRIQDLEESVILDTVKTFGDFAKRNHEKICEFVDKDLEKQRKDSLRNKKPNPEVRVVNMNIH